MFWYQIFFLFGFMIAVVLLAVASLQVMELDKKVQTFSIELMARYTKPLASLEDTDSSSPPHP